MKEKITFLVKTKKVLKSIISYREYLAVTTGILLFLLSGTLGSPNRVNKDLEGQKKQGNRSQSKNYIKDTRDKVNLMSREAILKHKGNSMNIGHGIKVKGHDLEELKIALLGMMGLGDRSINGIQMVKNGQIQSLSKENAEFLYQQTGGGNDREKRNDLSKQKIIESTIPRNISFSNLLFNNGIPPDQIIKIARSAKTLFNVDRIKAGKPYKLGLNPDQTFGLFEYEIDLEKYLLIKPYGKRFKSELKKILYQTRTEKISGTINSNLINAMKKAGVRDATVFQFVKIFSWKVDFFREIKKGDRFQILLERNYRRGEHVKDGKILAAILQTNGKLFDAIYFEDPAGFGEYFSSKGNSLKGKFLKSPLKYARISSGFSYRRYHPIYKKHLPHLSIDYAAPRGTPVHAVSKGIVVSKKRNSRAGNYITLDHNRIYQTSYSHLSKYAKGLKVGKQVKQGEVIGFVGSTGAATGPHLDFALKKDGKRINPKKLRFIGGRSISGKFKRQFSSIAHEYMETLGEGNHRIRVTSDGAIGHGDKVLAGRDISR